MLDPVSLAVGGLVLEALAGLAADATIGERIRRIRERRATRHAFERAIARAHSAFTKKHPDLVASFFDEHFIKNRAAAELKLFFSPRGEPNPERLAESYAEQFSRSIKGIQQPSEDFITLVEDYLIEEETLRELVIARRIEKTYREVREIRSLISDNLGSTGLLVESPTLDGSAVRGAFGRASHALLSWPQLSAGRWIERPELEALKSSVVRSQAPLSILVGPPGGGKSALLARLGTELASEGFALLAIKADQLPAECGSLRDLDAHLEDLGAPGPILDCLQVLASEQPVALLIDQLDALSELMDRRTGRLRALLALVHRAQSIEGLRIVLSSREVEYRHDARLASLDAEAVILETPPWEDVGNLLVGIEINTSRWPEEARETLRNVEHLSVFLTYFAEDPAAPVFDTYLSMLEALFQRRIEESGEGLSEIAYEIAKAMADSEELWVARARFPGKRDAIERLLAADLLRTVADGRRIGFRHQTMFEFVRARGFASGNASLADWILSKQEAIHVIRPVLWKALPYLRDADPGRYAREVARLWNADALRPHVRWILIGFLGGLEDPRGEEAGWLLSVFDRADRANLRRKALMAMTGSTGWFTRLRSRLPGLMSAPTPVRQPTAALLARTASFDPKAVRKLVDAHWARRSDRRWELYRVLHDVRVWEDDWVALALQLVSDQASGRRFTQLLIRQIGESHPEVAAKLLGATIRCQLELPSGQAPELPELPPPEASEEEQRWGRWKREETARKPFRALLTEVDWYRVPGAARRAPEAFLKELWPSVIKAAEAIASPSRLGQYRESQSLLYSFENPRDRTGGSLLSILLSAVESYAEKDPESFSDFVRTNQNSDLALVHRFLARGLAKAAAKAPKAALAYLLAGRERLAIGDTDDIHGETRRLIGAVLPHLSHIELQMLERVLLAYQRHDEHEAGLSSEDRREYLRWNRAHRLRLLRAIPEDRRSPRIQRTVLEEERALPGLPDYDLGPVEVSWIGSPMSADQMVRASDAQIMGLFQKIPSVARRGADASLPFAHFAKQQPNRAISLFAQFEPIKHHLVVAHAVRELATVETLEPDRLVDVIHNLANRGFGSDEFRCQAGWALEALAFRRQGLDSETCAMLEAWLTEWNEEAAVETTQELKVNPSSSILWARTGHALPEGNFPILIAIAFGYLCRKPMDADGWLDVVERHLGRQEKPRVWEALAPQLRYLVNANRDRAVAFVERLLDSHPELFVPDNGAELIAYTHGWLPSSLLTSVFDRWCRFDSSWGPQVAGEVIVLRYAQMPEDAWTTGRLAMPKEGPEIESTRIGMAYSAANLWGDVRFRDTLTPLIVELIEDASTSVASAVFELFRVNKPLPVDGATRRLLEGIDSHPHVLEAGSTFLLTRLKSLLFDVAFVEIIARILHALVDLQSEQIADISTGWSADADDLMQCALTLQRFPQTREDGVAIFESLIELDAYGVDNVLRDIDRRIQ